MPLAKVARAILNRSLERVRPQTFPEDTRDKKTYRQRWEDAAETVERALADLAEKLESPIQVLC